MAASDVQVLIVVDIYPGVSEAALETLLPPERRRVEVLRLSEFGAPKLERPPYTKPVDWYNMGEAIEKVAVRVHQIQDGARPHAMALYIGGRAPLAAFVHLGSMFTKSVQNVVVFNTPHEGSDLWEPFPMIGAATGIPTPNIFDKITGLPEDPMPTTGRVGLVIDSGRRSSGDSEPTEVFDQFIVAQNESVGTIVQLRSYDRQLTITETRMPAIVRQFAQCMSSLPHLFPQRSGLSLFVAGPTQIAFAIGRSINANVLVGNVWLTEYRREKNEYEMVYALPFVPRVEMPIPQTPEARADREHVLEVVIEALEELKTQVAKRHLPRMILADKERLPFMKRLGKLKILRTHPPKQPFQLRVQEGECFLGEGILQALVASTPDQQKRFAKLLLLHEMLHDWQALRSTNHSLIGRAGFVLEHIDYLADVFAVQTLVNADLDLDNPDPENTNEVRTSALKWLDMILHGIEAFDKAEQGNETMVRLSERRLRRYLLWHIQFARARTIETQKQFESLLKSSLTVELAPLSGWVDVKRWEKMVEEPLSDTELCIAVDGRLIRAGNRPDFSPSMLLDALRAYDRAGAHKQVNAVVDQERDKLMPWTKEG